MTETKFLSMQELETGLEEIRESPKTAGMLAMIVRRPDIDQRETLEDAELDQEQGLVGDSWKSRSSSRTSDGSAHPDMQLTLINARLLDLIAQEIGRWPLAGDQLVIDLDLSMENLPPGTRLSIGTAVIEITAQAHTGCAKFSARFGVDAHRWVNSATGKQLRLRGLNAKIIQSGTIQVGDLVRKL